MSRSLLFATLLLGVPTMASAASPVHDFDALWDYGDPAGTKAKFDALVEPARARGDAEYLLQLRTQIARTHSLQGQFDEANTLLDAVEAELTDGLVVVRVRYLLERGRTLNSAGDKKGARPLFEEAWRLGREAGEDFHAVDAAHMIAIVESGDGAMEWNLEALKVAEGSSDERARGWQGSLFNNIGWTHHEAGRYAEALAIFERALVFRTEQGKPGSIRVAKCCVARALRSLGRVEEALAAQQALKAEHTAAGSEDAYVEEELGECLHALGRTDEARPHFAAAYAALSKDSWMVANEAERLTRLKELAGLD